MAELLRVARAIQTGLPAGRAELLAGLRVTGGAADDAPDDDNDGSGAGTGG